MKGALTQAIEGRLARAALNAGLTLSAHPQTLALVRRLYKARAALFVMRRERVRQLTRPLGVANTEDLTALELRLEALTRELAALQEALSERSSSEGASSEGRS
jgi:hypothetical protein